MFLRCPRSLSIKMGDWTLRQQWSLNGHVVPLVPGKADVEDIWTLSDTGSLENADLFFLNLKATKATWMGKVLQLKPKSWYYHSGTVPFLQEVREAIQKAQSECIYLTKRSVVVILIRDQALKVQNELRSVRLAFEKEELQEKLIWCLKEILQDIEAKEPRDPDAQEPRLRQPRRRNEEGIEGYEDEHIDACIRELKRHEGCKSVLFCASRRAFQVRRNDNLAKYFTVKGLSKKRRFFKAHKGLETQLDEKHFKDLEESCISAVHQAKDWLDWWTLENLGEPRSN